MNKNGKQEYRQHRLIRTEDTWNFVWITRWFEFSGVGILFELAFFLTLCPGEVFEYDKVLTLPVFTISGVDCKGVSFTAFLLDLHMFWYMKPVLSLVFESAGQSDPHHWFDGGHLDFWRDIFLT